MNKCIVCGAETKNKLYCSQACRSKNATCYTKECDFCGREFTTKTKTQRYCDRYCYDRFIKLTRTVKVECKTCGKIYQAQAARANTTKYCSRECQFIGVQKASRVKPITLTDKDKAAEKLEELQKKEKPIDKKVCATCHYCQLAGRPTEDKGCWTCVDKGSEFYQSLLNIDESGYASRDVTWEGCNRWRIERNKRQVKKRTDPTTFRFYEIRLKQIKEQEAKIAKAKERC